LISGYSKERNTKAAQAVPENWAWTRSTPPRNNRARTIDGRDADAALTIIGWRRATIDALR
jgi:hypothetical protein